MSSVTCLWQVTREIFLVALGVIFCSFIKSEEGVQCVLDTGIPTSHTFQLTSPLLRVEILILSLCLLLIKKTRKNKKKLHTKIRCLLFYVELETSFRRPLSLVLTSLWGPHLECCWFGSVYWVKTFSNWGAVRFAPSFPMVWHIQKDLCPFLVFFACSFVGSGSWFWFVSIL